MPDRPSLLGPPLIEEWGSSRLLRVFRGILYSALAIVALLALSSPFLQANPWPVLNVYGALFVVVLAALALIHAGRLRSAGVLFVVSIWLVNSAAAYFFGGLRSPAMIAYAVVVMVAGFFTGVGSAVAVAVLSSLAGLVFLWAEARNLLPVPDDPISAERIWAGLTATLAMTSVLLILTLRSLRSAIDEAVRNERRFAAASKREEEARRALEDGLRQSQKLESIGRLAGGIAHDFSNFLSIILINCSLLRDRRDLGDLKARVDEIRGAADRAAFLTQQLLAFGRRQVLEPRVLALEDVVAGIEPMLSRLIGEDIDLVLKIDARAGNVRADPAQLEQVILNLALNARDAMPAGGVLTIETAGVELGGDCEGPPTSAKPGPHVLLTVSDTGAGIDESIREQLFEPFFTTKPFGEGTGLGLAVVHGIVTQSGGYVDVLDAPGHGTSFKIYLPRVEEEIAAARPMSRAPHRDNGQPASETLLVVEDEPGVLEATCKALIAEGYTVFASANAEEALATFAACAGKIDLLITDVVLPKVSGPQLAARMRDVRPQLRVLYLSGYAEESVSRYGLRDRSFHFLAKPFTAVGLAEKVRETLGWQ